MIDLEKKSFRLGDWLVRPSAGILEQKGNLLRLEPKIMEVLCYLASRPGEVVTRDDIEREVWHGAEISYDSITSTITKLRKVLVDDPREPLYITTVCRPGE